MIELHQRTNGEEGFDFETAVAQALSFLLAGFDTIANLLMWTCYYFAVFPEMQQQIREEIETVLGPGVKNPSYESLGSLKNLGMTCNKFFKIFEILLESFCQFYVLKI